MAESSVAEFIKGSSQNYVRVRSPQRDHLARILTASGATAEVRDDGALAVTDAGEEAIGELAAKHGITLYELYPQNASLEDAFMEMTRDSVQYHGSDSSRHPTLTTQVA